MNDAELTAGIDANRIGWVQVGLAEVGDVVSTRVPSAPVQPVQGYGYYAYAPSGVHRRHIEPSMVLPALIQCFDDALRRFGVVELSGFQVTANFLDTRTQSYVNRLVSGLNWFNTTLRRRADALIAFDQELLGGHTEAELVSSSPSEKQGWRVFGGMMCPVQ